jgi:hypothetical protein
MQHDSRQAQLYLNGVLVGTVKSEGSESSWGFGQFTPAPEFERFATIFGAWSILIHEEEDRRASREALEELNAAEKAIDAIKAEMLWLDTQERIHLGMITIDGPLIEWKMDSVRAGGAAQ